MVYGKVPPQAKDIEDAILGACMLEKEAFFTISEILKPECFYVDANQQVFRSMMNLAGRKEPIDILTVTEELRSRGELEAVGGPFYVTKLTNAVVSAAHIEDHSKIILNKWINRELIRVSGELLHLAYEEGSNGMDLLDYASAQINKVSDVTIPNQVVELKDALWDRIKRLHDWRLRILENPNNKIIGVPTGFFNLDGYTGGWQAPDLIILAARPSVGKTSLALALAKNAATDRRKPTPVAVFSLEMSMGQLVDRIIASEAMMPLEIFTRAEGLTEDNLEKLYTTGIQPLSRAPIFIDDTPAINIVQLRSKCRRLVKQCGVGLIIIDYLQLMSGSAGEQLFKVTNREQEVSAISRSLKGLAKELNVPIIALSQLNRASEGRDKPQLSDLRESGAIEQDADVVIFLQRQFYQMTEEDIKKMNKEDKERWERMSPEDREDLKNSVDVYIRKNRSGGLGELCLYALLQFQGWFDQEQYKEYKFNLKNQTPF